MVDIASTTEPILSTEDWAFQVTAQNADGTPFDLSTYVLKAQFRILSLSTLLDTCSTTDGDIVLTADPSIANITSYASSRTWLAGVDTTIFCDVMAYRTDGSQDRSIGIGRLLFKVLAGGTHD